MDIEIGPQIRARRTAQELTLAQLAEKSGVSAAMLCDIEAGKKNPTIRVVNQIARGLECGISDLLDLPPANRCEVTRVADRRVLLERDSGVERHLLAPPLVGRGIQVLMYVIPPGATTERFAPEPAGVIEHVTVVRGRVLALIGEEAYELETGDSMTYTADVPHGTTNPGDEPAEVLLVIDATRPGMPSGVGFSGPA